MNNEKIGAKKNENQVLQKAIASWAKMERAIARSQNTCDRSLGMKSIHPVCRITPGSFCSRFI
jgi:hypothetical protein